MTALHPPTSTTVEDAEGLILRALRDAEGEPVPLSELDGLAPRTVLSAALNGLTRAGLLDVHAGHISLSHSRIHHHRHSEEEK